MDVTARQGDQALRLASGVTLNVQFPIPQAAVAAAPASIGLWSIDATTGRWLEEGTAQREASTSAPSHAAYAATLTHLSTWNCDVSMVDDTTYIRGCVVSAADGQPVPRARVQAVGVDHRGESSATTAPDGCFAVNVRRSSQVRLVASPGTVSSMPRTVSTPDVVMNAARDPAACADVGNLPIGEPLVQMVLQWGDLPRDLDSHLTGPQTAGARFHVYYGSRGGHRPSALDRARHRRHQQLRPRGHHGDAGAERPLPLQRPQLLGAGRGSHRAIGCQRVRDRSAARYRAALHASGHERLQRQPLAGRGPRRRRWSRRARRGRQRPRLHAGFERRRRGCACA